MKPIRYISTRSNEAPVSFEAALLAGLAPDGGLYVPETFPKFSGSVYRRFASADYKQIAFKTFSTFMHDFIPAPELKTFIERAYGSFRSSAITPLKQLDKDAWLLELWHGESHSFKDIAMQILAPLLDEALKRKGDKANILCATSGDTGAAAMAAFAKSSQVNVFVLYPQGGISDIQRKQMTTHQQDHLHSLAVQGSFDDCQKIVKQLFNDRAFNDEVNLAAVNSINWVRIMAQTVYYFAACLALGANQARKINFIVPTGNFGDIYAGFVAKKMGAPIAKLVIANNANGVLTEVLRSGLYQPQATKQTLAPAMDIQAPSNFERVLFEFYQRRSDSIKTLFSQLEQEGEVPLPEYNRNKIRKHFTAQSIADEEILATIKECYHSNELLIDPHTATGLASFQKLRKRLKGKSVILSTASPSKFPKAIQEATGVEPPRLVFDQRERVQEIENSASAIADYIKRNSQCRK